MRVVARKQLEGAVHEAQMFLSEPDYGTREIEHRVGIGFFGRRIDGRVIGVDGDPGLGGAKAGVRTGIPLHGGPRVIAAHIVDRFHGLIWAQAFVQRALVIIERFHIPIIVNRRERDIGHAELFPLINVRRAAERKVQKQKRLSRFAAVPFVVPKPRKRSWLVMIHKEVRIPRAPLKAHLPAFDYALELNEIDGFLPPFVPIGVVHTHEFELKEHVELTPIFAHEVHRIFNRRTWSFSHGHDIEAFQGLMAHFPHVIVEFRPIDIGRGG